MIPVISWIILCGRCRYCKQTISWLYPCIELFTAIVMVALLNFIPTRYIPAYIIFFSALIITIRTDIETLLISRIVTLFLVPIGVLFSFLKLIPITPLNSISGTLFGYFFLYSFSKIFQKITHREGIGSGDFDLLAFIGSFTGITGCWISLMIGSLLGSLFGLSQIIRGKANRTTKIPFGPFLAIGALIFVLFQDSIVTLLSGMSVTV